MSVRNVNLYVAAFAVLILCLAKIPSAFSFIAFHRGAGWGDRAAPNR